MTIQYRGGYHIHKDSLVRGYGPNAHTARDLGQLSNYTVEATNHVQDTQWETNEFVLDVVQSFREVGKDVVNAKKDVILHFVRPMHPRKDLSIECMQQIDKEVWKALSKEDKAQRNKRRAKVLENYESTVGSLRATERIIDTAAEMAEHDRYYFPHNLDFRTRMYPMPTDLTPQSNDLSKGLIRFHQARQIGEEGHYWMAVRVATNWGDGQDKASMDDRWRFAMDADFMANCQDWVEDPVANRGWLKAEEPFQFLAIIHEWVMANMLPNPYEFMSKQPGNLDGSCNGAQHLSIMSRDLVGAEATNCRNGTERQDLYMEVADRVWAEVQKAANHDPMAAQWYDKMSNPDARRKVVKRAVMTVPYGVSEYGVAKFVMKEHVSEEWDNEWDSAKYMRNLIWDSINETLDKGRTLQLWFSACATICAEAGLPFCWDTPAGSKITQAYRQVVMKRVNGFNTRFTIYEEMQEGETYESETYLKRVPMDVKKMATSAPPNVVHSCDASHLQITVCRMHDAGIREFSMIHDSFGCPLSQVGLMRDILRQSAVDMYSDEYLKQFKESVEHYSELKMPDLEGFMGFEYGDFDINEILKSEFFFS